jgi:hypothetical protein
MEQRQMYKERKEKKRKARGAVTEKTAIKTPAQSSKTECIF